MQALLLCRGQRVIYTTPLKALSNQKLYEMRQRFGSDTVGLQTGDASLNVDSSIVVMTTEVLRNIMYRIDASATGAAPPTSRGSHKPNFPSRSNLDMYGCNAFISLGVVMWTCEQSGEQVNHRRWSG